MDDSFNIDVVYEGKELTFEARLAAVGYTHKFYVMVNAIEVIYEPDEDRNYRAIVNSEVINQLKPLDRTFIQLIGDKLGKIKE